MECPICDNSSDKSLLFGVRAGIIIKIFLYGQINGRAYCLGLDTQRGNFLFMGRMLTFGVDAINIRKRSVQFLPKFFSKGSFSPNKSVQRGLSLTPYFLWDSETCQKFIFSIFARMPYFLMAF